MAYMTSPGFPSPPDADTQQVLEAPAPQPTGGYTSPGFRSPTPYDPAKAGEPPRGQVPAPMQNVPDWMQGRPSQPPGRGRGRLQAMRAAMKQRKLQGAQGQLVGSWLGATKSRVGQDQPTRLNPGITQNPYIKMVGGAAGRPGRRLGRGYAGGRRFQRGLGNAYGRFMKGGAIDQGRGFARPMPSRDFSRQIQDRLNRRRNQISMNKGRGPVAPINSDVPINAAPTTPPTGGPGPNIYQGSGGYDGKVGQMPQLDTSAAPVPVDPSWVEQYGRHAR